MRSGCTPSRRRKAGRAARKGFLVGDSWLHFAGGGGGRYAEFHRLFGTRSRRGRKVSPRLKPVAGASRTGRQPAAGISNQARARPGTATPRKYRELLPAELSALRDTFWRRHRRRRRARDCARGKRAVSAGTLPNRGTRRIALAQPADIFAALSGEGSALRSPG